MSMHKNIFWRGDLEIGNALIAELPPSRFVTPEMFANIHVVICYNQGTIDDMRKMADILREVNPNITDDEVYCSKVTKSSYCQSGTLVAWNGVIDYRKYDGWRDTHNNPDYYWA